MDGDDVVSSDGYIATGEVYEGVAEILWWCCGANGTRVIYDYAHCTHVRIYRQSYPPSLLSLYMNQTNEWINLLIVRGIRCCSTNVCDIGPRVTLLTNSMVSLRYRPCVVPLPMISTKWYGNVNGSSSNLHHHLRRHDSWCNQTCIEWFIVSSIYLYQLIVSYPSVLACW